jgi:hypothetical protein
MTRWPALDRFLDSDPSDVGCGEVMKVLHIYVDLVASGEDVEGRYRGVTAHLRMCGPCGEDFEGLLLAVTDGHA